MGKVVKATLREQILAGGRDAGRRSL